MLELELDLGSGRGSGQAMVQDFRELVLGSVQLSAVVSDQESDLVLDPGLVGVLAAELAWEFLDQGQDQHWAARQG